MLSFVIPTRNNLEELKVSLSSIFTADVTCPFEVIVVDDFSEDFYLFDDIVWDFIYVKLLKWDGAGHARNFGAEISKYPYLIFLDSDCRVPKDYMISVLFELNSGKEVFSGGYKGWINTSIVARLNYYELLERRKYVPRRVDSFTSCNLVMKRDIFNEAKGFPTYIKGAAWEDMELAISVRDLSPIYWSEKISVCHHFRNGVVGYLKRQFYNGLGTVFLSFRFPQLLTHKTTESGSYLEVFLFLLIIVSIFLLGKTPLPLYFSLFFFMFLYLKWSWSIRKKDYEPLSFFILSFPVVILKNLIWTLSIVSSLGYLLFFKINGWVRIF